MQGLPLGVQPQRSPTTTLTRSCQQAFTKIEQDADAPTQRAMLRNLAWHLVEQHRQRATRYRSSREELAAAKAWELVMRRHQFDVDPLREVVAAAKHATETALKAQPVPVPVEAETPQQRDAREYFLG